MVARRIGATISSDARPILWTTAEVLRIVTVLTHPVLPESTAKVWALLGQPGALGAVDLDGLRWGQLAPGRALGKSQALFPRIEKTEAIERMEAMEKEAQNAPSPVAATHLGSAAPAGAGAAGCCRLLRLRRRKR